MTWANTIVRYTEPPHTPLPNIAPWIYAHFQFGNLANILPHFKRCLVSCSSLISYGLTTLTLDFHLAPHPPRVWHRLGSPIYSLPSGGIANLPYARVSLEIVQRGSECAYCCNCVHLMQTPYILPKVVFLCVLSDGTVMDLDDTGRKYLYSIAFVLGDYWKALAVELIRECTNFKHLYLIKWFHVCAQLSLWTLK